MNTPRYLRIFAAIAIAFGILTIASGGRALFGDAEVRAAMGNTIGFVLWFNFLAGFAYVLAGVGLWMNKRWAAWAALLLALATTLVIAGFVVHVMGGGHYEIRTAGALALRLGFWVWVASLALPTLRRHR